MKSNQDPGDWCDDAQSGNCSLKERSAVGTETAMWEYVCMSSMTGIGQ